MAPPTAPTHSAKETGNQVTYESGTLGRFLHKVRAQESSRCSRGLEFAEARHKYKKESQWTSAERALDEWDLPESDPRFHSTSDRHFIDHGKFMPYNYQFLGETRFASYPFKQESGAKGFIKVRGICSTGILLDTDETKAAIKARNPWEDVNKGYAVTVDSGPFYDTASTLQAKSTVKWGQVFDQTLADPANREKFVSDVMSAVKRGDILTIVLDPVRLTGSMQISLKHHFRGHIGTLPDDAKTVEGIQSYSGDADVSLVVLANPDQTKPESAT